MSDSQSKQENSNEQGVSQQSIQASPSVENEAKSTDNENSVEEASSDNNSSESSDSSSSTSNSEIKLKSLTPSDDYVEYNEILKNVFVGEEHKNDHNIAITADYGEGKSSVINSFLRKNPKI